MVEQIDAVAWLPNRLSKQRNHKLHFVFHTIALQYFLQESKDKIAHALAQAGDRATHERPLGYMSMEITDDLYSARLNLQLWPGGQVHDVGRADFHGRWDSWGSSHIG